MKKINITAILSLLVLVFIMSANVQNSAKSMLGAVYSSLIYNEENSIPNKFGEVPDAELASSHNSLNPDQLAQIITLSNSFGVSFADLSIPQFQSILELARSFGASVPVLTDTQVSSILSLAKSFLPNGGSLSTSQLEAILQLINAFNSENDQEDDKKVSIDMKVISRTANVIVDDVSGNDTGVFEVVMDITAVGGKVYIGDTATSTTNIVRNPSVLVRNGFTYQVSKSGVPITNGLSDVITFTTPNGVRDSIDNIEIQDGTTSRVTLTVKKSNYSAGDAGFYYLELGAIGFGLNDDTTYEYVHSFGDFRTPTIFLRGNGNLNVDPSANINVFYKNAEVITNDTPGNDTGIFTFKLDITAKDGKIYVGDTAVAVGSTLSKKIIRDAFIYRVYKDGVILSGGDLSDVITFTTPNGVRDSIDNIEIQDGTTSRVTLTIRQSNDEKSDGGIYYAELVAIAWGAADDTIYEFVKRFNKNQFVTSAVFLRGNSPDATVSTTPSVKLISSSVKGTKTEFKLAITAKDKDIYLLEHAGLKQYSTNGVVFSITGATPTSGSSLWVDGANPFTGSGLKTINGQRHFVIKAKTTATAIVNLDFTNESDANNVSVDEIRYRVAGQEDLVKSLGIRIRISIADFSKNIFSLFGR